jgi:hypothetical protein
VRAHHFGERLGLAARVDLLAGNRRVRRADDVLTGKIVADAVAAADTDCVRPGRQPSDHLVHLAVLPTHMVGKAER